MMNPMIFFSHFNVAILECVSEFLPKIDAFLITFRKQSLNPSDQNKARLFTRH